METPRHHQAELNMAWPLPEKPTKAYTMQLESRLLLVEQQLTNLLTWQSGIALASLGKFPHTPAASPQLERSSALNVQTEISKDPVVEVVETIETKQESIVEIIEIEPEEELLVELVLPQEKHKDSPEQRKTHDSVTKTNVSEQLRKGTTEPKPEQNAVIDNTPATRLAINILAIIGSYGQHLQAPSDEPTPPEWLGKLKFLDRVRQQVEKNEPIRMILPAFPWKSINKVDKVNGSLPDLGEVLALARLNSLCEDIKSIYPIGGQVTIATDGLVFDDIVGIPEEETWAYSEALMTIAAERGFTNIRLARAMDLLGLTSHPMTKELYLSLTSTCRTQLLSRYGRTEDEIRTMMQTDSDTLLTYRGFIRFLETDLKHSPVAKSAPSGSQFRKCVKKVAAGMMIRAESFTKLIQDKCREFVRLSIHPSTGTVKLSVPLIVQKGADFPKTPWHSTIAVALDGSYRTVHSKDVRNTHTLVYHKGRPYYYREKSALWDWDQGKAVFEPQYPNRLLVYPHDDTRAERLDHLQVDKLRKLAEVFEGPIEVFGFTNAADVFAAKSIRIK